MSLKSKIITKLKAYVKEKGYNLSNARINTLSDRLDTKVDKEDGIDEAIENMDSLVDFKELASLDDAKRNAEKKAAEEADKKDPANPPADPANPPAPDKKEGDEMPAWFKQHTESQNKIIESLTSKITAFEQGNVIQTRRQQLEAKLKDAPEKFKARALRDFDRLKIDSEDDFTSYLADIEQDVADEIQLQSDAGLGVDAPNRGVGGAKLKEEEVSSEMKELIADRKAAAEAAKATA